VTIDVFGDFIKGLLARLLRSLQAIPIENEKPEWGFPNGSNNNSIYSRVEAFVD
jgi:hypothetical protein